MIDTHPTPYKGVIPTPTWAFRQYERIRHWLPDGLPMDQRPNPQLLDNLLPLANQFQVYVFDAFGVLNAGPRAFPAAIQRFRELQRMGKHVQILSNAATASHAKLVEKYRRMGFDITPDQLISSRWLLEQSLANRAREGLWGVIAPENSEPGFFTHRAREAGGTLPQFYGKPYAPAFQAVIERFTDIPPGQILMVGDTLHTDILGGQNAGMKTLLVTAEGSLQGMDIPNGIAQSGIAPDFIAPKI